MSSTPPFDRRLQRIAASAPKKTAAQIARLKTLRPHPLRDQIVEVMRSYGQPISPSQIAKIVDETLGSTADHVRTLVAAGVIYLSHEARVRGAVEHYYSLAPEHRDGQLSDPVTSLLILCGALMVPSPDDGYPMPAALDTRGREQLNTILDQLRAQVQEVAATATRRTSG